LSRASTGFPASGGITQGSAALARQNGSVGQSARAAEACAKYAYGTNAGTFRYV
jgi:hypothetical protein